MIHHQLDGPADAPLVVLSNSLGTDLGMWDAVVPHLTPERRVLRWDVYGHGRSDTPAGPYTLQQLASELADLVAAQQRAPADFVGLSLGGSITMQLAAHRPELLRRQVLCCTTAGPNDPDVWRERIETVRAQGTSALAEATMQRWFTPEFREQEPAQVQRVRTMVEDTRDEGYAGCAAALADMTVYQDLGAITAPALVVSGAEDPSSPPENGQILAGRIRGAEHVTIDHCAHMAAVQQPARLAQLIVDHLGSAAPPAGGG